MEIYPYELLKSILQSLIQDLKGLDWKSLREFLESKKGQRTAYLGHSLLYSIDPDIYPTVFQRLSGRKGASRQGGKAQRHLEKKGVDKGDVFLFFGRFKEVIKDYDQYSFALTNSALLSILAFRLVLMPNN